MADLFATSGELDVIRMHDADVRYARHIDLPGPCEELLRRLIADIPWRAESIVVWGKTHLQPRLLAWYGDPGASYVYSGIRHEPLPWTSDLLAIKARVEAVAGEPFNSVLANYYRDERDSMGLHSDDEPELGERPVIASLSLGAERTLTFKHKTRAAMPSVRITLGSGSLLVMRGDTQRFWKHGVGKQSRACGPRVNLTSRPAATQARSIRAAQQPRLATCELFHRAVVDPVCAMRGIGRTSVRDSNFFNLWAARSPALGGLVAVLWSAHAHAQTPSPLQEWQYSGGIVLQQLFVPNLPEWNAVLGAAYDDHPLYDGASRMRTQGGPVINVRYRDIVFASVGEGLGVNLVRGEHYRGGVALTYDLGRYVDDDIGHLRGLGDIKRAPAFKAFGSYVVSKEFPLVIRADVRQIVGGADGLTGDLGVYLPLPGSSRRFVMFAGPSYTFADRRYMQRVFGVSTAQSLDSAFAVYGAHAGSDAVGLGFSATGFITDHWLLNLDSAVNRLLGSAADSPITEKTVQHVITASVSYKW